MLAALLLLLATAGAVTAADPWRPAYHFAPAKNWMNDPNGLVFHDGEYHLFFQYNPEGNTWGHMSWGHAVSHNLLSWTELPVPLREEDGIMVYSGSAVVDRRNTSGLCRTGEPCLVAIYTGRTPKLQHQNLAFSHDRGRTFTKYTGNPVLDIGSKAFRDPKVIWHEPTKQWVMVVALPREKKVRFYGSADLRSWTALSEFGPAGATNGIWECPDLFPLDGRWVLVVSLNPGGPAGGSGGQYFIGHFDGRRFVAEHRETLWLDHGADMYATVSFFGTPGRRIWLGWMSNWLYAEKEPTTTWRTAQTVPREVRLARVGGTLRLVQQPVRELAGARRPAKLAGFRGDSYELEATIDLRGATEAGFLVRKGQHEETRVGVRNGEVFLDRTRSGAVAFHPQFAAVHTAPLATARPVKLRVLVDRSSVEVFAGAGEVTLTDRIFPAADSLGLETFSTGGPARLSGVRVWTLQPR